MATEKDFELLDDYIANRLNGAERSSFEQKLNADPDLQNEYSLQQNLVEGIRKARATELKAMLQSVPVPAPTQGGSISFGVKAALGTFVAAMIATGVYLYFKTDEQVVNSQKTEAVNAPSPSATEPKQTAGDEARPQVETEKTPVVNAQPEKQSVSKPGNEEAKQPVTREIDVFDPSTESDETPVSADESPRTSAGHGGSSIAVEIDKQHKQYGFHYQFRDGKLFLYGPFEKNLYEILEIFSDEKRTMFLYYKDGYYLLKEDGDKIKPLTAITDPVLVGKLKDYRKN
jgi:hypothetical protein